MAQDHARKTGLQNLDSRSNEFYQALLNSNVPLDFYGKVVDEASNAVAGVSVSFAWNKDSVTNPLRSGENTLATQSDFSGRFSLQGAQGRFLDVRMAKEGYYTPSPGIWSVRYSAETRFSPDSPMVFVLRKKGKPEPLIRLAGAMGGDRQYRLDTKGTPTEISFYTGQRTSTGEGHLRVEYWMEAPQDPKQGQFQWHCRISVPRGGLQSITDEFPFSAPEEGYREAIEIMSESSVETWSDRVNQSYYVRLADGKYGRVKLNLVCGANPFFGVDVLINPSGSRNLEYDKYLPGNTLVNQSSP